MGGKDPNRQPKLASVKDTPDGWLRLATCTHCANVGVLPAAAMIRKHGELHMLEFALVGLKCSSCGGHGATHSMVRLCDPGCPRRTVGGFRVAAE